MSLTMFFAGLINLFVGIALGLAVYVGGLFVLRVFGDEEKGILREILPARLGERLGW